MKHISAGMQLPKEHPMLAGHFPQAPVAPGAWLLSMIERECRLHLGEGIQIVAVDYARFRSPLGPGESFSIELSSEADCCISFRLMQNTRSIAEGKFSYLPAHE